MESTQNKIYEIEESTLFDQNLLQEESKKPENDQDLFNYGDKFDEENTKFTEDVPKHTPSTHKHGSEAGQPFS